MSLRRVFVLLGKEVLHGSKNFIFVFALVIPIVLTLIVSLLFGTLFSGKPKLGITDQGNSKLASMLVATDTLLSKKYLTDTELRQAVESGAVDLGLVIPENFDTELSGGEETQLSAYIWGESLLKNRAIIGTSLIVLVRELIGQDVPVEILTTAIGEGEIVPWEERLFPFIILMAIVLGGTMVPATSLVDEKQKRTLKALVITPTSLGEVFSSKGLFGFLVSFFVCIVTLLLNRAFGNQPFLLLGVLSLSAIMAATFGVLLGALIRDINSLFAIIKALGLVLYAPAIVFLFPAIPQWIGKLFPTYYMIAPIIEISQNNASWRQVSSDIFILLGIVIMLIGIIAVIARRESGKEV